MMESSDPVSFPSEPPHIGNWFSSYAYESPVLSNIDDLGEGKTCKEDNFVKNRVLGAENCLSSGENADSDGDNKCAIELLRSSENPTLSSEPLDINDGFCSYVPETPMSDENGDISIPESNKTNDLKDNGDSKRLSCETFKEKADEIFSKDTRQAATDGWLSKGLVRCNTSIESPNCSNKVIRSSDYLSVSPETMNIDGCLDSYVPETQFDEGNHSRVPESNDNELNDYGGMRGLNSSLGKAETDEKYTRNGMKEESYVHHLEGIVKFKTTKENYENLSQNLPSSNDIALSSEPPDIKNWFSSYVYESPTLDSSGGFSFSIHEESEFDVEEFSHSGQRKLQNLGSTKAVHLNDKNASQPSPKKGHDSTGNKNLSFSQANTQKKKIQNLEYNSTENFATSLDGKSSAEKLETTLPEEIGLRLSDANICSSNQHENQSLIQRRDSAEHNILLSTHNDSNKTTDGLQRKLSRTEPSGESINKENQENGFISTRKVKSRKLHDENSYKSGHDKDTIATRRVFSDTTNIHQNQPINTSQITVKWRCPQKRKPNPDPPLKQLRLEQWVRRL